VTTNDTDQVDAGAEQDVSSNPPPGGRSSFRRVMLARLSGHGRIVTAVALVAVAAVIGGAYLVGGPPSAGAHTDSLRAALSVQGQSAYAGAPVSGNGLSQNPAGLNSTDAGSLSGKGTSSTGQTPAGGQSALFSSIESTQIVKTGQLSLEVGDIDSSLTKAQAAIVGLGGYVDSSNRSGTGADATASITFRVPAGKWEEALSDLRKIGSKILSEQTGTTDVTSQVIDLDARIANLQTTESALQAIMARATAIADVIAVENQLSDTQGQIEELTAERDHLKSQAALSTLTVTLQLPATTVTTQATQDWTLGGQIDEAGAALVRIGQGLATMGVWIVVVALPLGLAALMLFAIVAVTRRMLGRGRRRNAALPA
jgi:hypothetical protein